LKLDKLGGWELPRDATMVGAEWKFGISRLLEIALSESLLISNFKGFEELILVLLFYVRMPESLL
jgi:hypothetical protein